MSELSCGLKEDEMMKRYLIAATVLLAMVITAGQEVGATTVRLSGSDPRHGLQCEPKLL